MKIKAEPLVFYNTPTCAYRMDAASRNIDGRLERLHRDAQVGRQNAMAKEMLDVVTGAEATLNG